MDIEKLLDRKDKLLAEATALIAKGNVSQGMLKWPLASQEARMDRIRQRIETLTELKAEHARQIDSEIEMLSTELSQLGGKIEADRQTLEPDIRPTAPEPVKKAVAKGTRRGAQKKEP